MDNIIKNYEEVLAKPPSTRLYLKFLKHKFDAKRKYKKDLKKSNNISANVENNPPTGIEISTFAIIVDNVVVDVMHVQKEFGEILQKQPEFVFIEKGEHKPHQGWIYRDGKFISLDDLRFESKVTTRG